MQIQTAVFVKGITDISQIPSDGFLQVALIGRSNVGKSSTINLLTKQKALARTSNTPGRTQEINVFLINNKWYLVDLPGYGYARTSGANRERISELIGAYLFETEVSAQKVVLIIDANVGATKDDLEMLAALEDAGKHIIVALNKIDKIKKSQLHKQLASIRVAVGPHTIVPYSAVEKIGIGELLVAMAA